MAGVMAPLLVGAAGSLAALLSLSHEVEGKVIGNSAHCSSPSSAACQRFSLG